MSTSAVNGDESANVPQAGQDTTARRTAAQYLAAINLHAERNKESFLYPGVNYRFLSRFLAREPTPEVDLSPDPFKFVCIHTYEPNGLRNTVEYDGSSCLWTGPFSQNEKPDPNDGTIVFLRGYLSPNWITEIGALYKVDPEFFRRHMDFLKSKNYHDLPGLQSGSQTIVQLKITTICTRNSAINRDRVLLARRVEEEDVLKHQRKLGLNGIAGESIVRKFSVHNETTFTIEQIISCHIKPRRGSNAGWTAIVWLDSGRDLNEGPLGPWLVSSASGRLQNEFNPVLQYRPMMALRPQENDHMLGPPQRNTQLSATNHGIAQANNAAQSANLLHSQYGSSMETPAARHDAMYALNELFLFAANSECQFINFMASQIALEMSTFEEHMMHSLHNLRFNKTLIDNHIAHLLQFVAFLKSSRTNTRSKDEMVNEVIHGAQDSLLKDYENLIERARDLAARCIEGASDITSKAMLEQSAQAIDESKRVNRLTLLAFFFLPLSLGTGIFGMNFKEFGTGILGIWVCVPVFVTIIAISMVMAFPEGLRRPWACLQGRPGVLDGQ